MKIQQRISQMTVHSIERKGQKLSNIVHPMLFRTPGQSRFYNLRDPVRYRKGGPLNRRPLSLTALGEPSEGAGSVPPHRSHPYQYGSAPGIGVEVQMGLEWDSGMN